jgi:hypothetical protein
MTVGAVSLDYEAGASLPEEAEKLSIKQSPDFFVTL